METYLRNDWIEKEYFPFFHNNKRKINLAKSSSLGKNPYLLEYLLEDGFKNLWSLNLEKSELNYEVIWGTAVHFMSSNPSLSLKLILKHPKEIWDWSNVSCNTGIKITEISNNPQHPWRYDNVSKHPDLNAEIVLCNFSMNWNWDALCNSQHVNMLELLNYSRGKECPASRRLQQAANNHGIFYYFITKDNKTPIEIKTTQSTLNKYNISPRIIFDVDAKDTDEETDLILPVEIDDDDDDDEDDVYSNRNYNV